MDRKKILVIVPFLLGGGAERVISILINNFSREKFDIHLALIANQSRPIDGVPKDVTLHLWNHRKASRGILRLVRLMADLQPDVVLSTLGYVNLLVMLLRPLLPRKTKFIARESNLPSLHLDRFCLTQVMKLLYRLLYPKFDLVICQSQDMKNDLVSAFEVPAGNTATINNPVDIHWIERKLADNEAIGLRGRIKLLAVGKLTHQKGFDLLLKAFSLIKDEKFYLTIIGDGPEKLNLSLFARDFGITDRIEFTGFVANPYRAMQEADLFVLSSRYEGFPNVVLEANACGTPVVAFDCPGGISEIIRNGFNGWLVTPGNIEELANTIVAAAKESIRRKDIKQYIEAKYGVQKIAFCYEKVIEDVLEGKECLL